MVKGIRFYSSSSTVRAPHDVTTRLPRRFTSLDHVWVTAVVLFPRRRVSCFMGRGCYRKRSKQQRANRGLA
ncbi:uncharacterized protein V6R79_013170 [Siganus canaliculatus]